jgi:hypothetical protein
LPWIEIADQLPRYAFGRRDAPASIGPRRSEANEDRVRS